jgi:DeoR/GlpR family transcriptional regulator of sugar metabolism
MNEHTFAESIPSQLNERQIEIVNEIREHSTVRVSELSRLFNVSEETIRRDFERLESHELLVRVHGGATSPELQKGAEIPVLKRKEKNTTEKNKIAQKAASFVENGDIIAIDASTTTLKMVRYLKGKKITVITNSLGVTLELGKELDVQVILVGGYLAKESMSLVGNFAKKVIQDYHVDKIFYSCMGLDFKRGVSEIDEAQAIIKKQLINIAAQQYLLLDNSKFGVKSLVKLCEIKEIDHIITDNQVSIDQLGELKQIGMKTHIAE